jgi:catechol 2,3-dioxygenase-like lactoylglutathione lyase family enzyme
MYITKLDHLVLTVRNVPAAIFFYPSVLGLEHIGFAGK